LASYPYPYEHDHARLHTMRTAARGARLTGRAGDDSPMGPHDLPSLRIDHQARAPHRPGRRRRLVPHRMRDRTQAADGQLAASSVTSSPRCLVPGCPVVYRSGDDRLCPIHADEDGDTMAARMEAFADLAAPPGEHEPPPGMGSARG
jgi:hypothetical protein